MAGRTSPNEGINYILEPSKHNINLNKCIFFIISITPAGSQGLHRSGRENIELPNDLIDISNLIEIFSEEPFLIPEDKIKVFVNVEESEKIYFELIKASRNKDIENIIILYQGFGKIIGNRTLLLLSEYFNDDSSNYLVAGEMASILQSKKDINVVMFVDCSYSARIFDEINNDNFVVIASSGKDQHAYFKSDKKTGKITSIFSSSLIQMIQETLKKGKDSLTLSDLYLGIRMKMIESLNELSDKAVQLPAISTRNLTQFYSFISAKQDVLNENTKNIDPGIQLNFNPEEYSVSDLKNLLARDRTKKVLSILSSTNSILDEEDKNEIILQKSRYLKVSRERRLNLIDKDYSDLKINNINLAILDLLDDLNEFNEGILF